MCRHTSILEAHARELQTINRAQETDASGVGGRTRRKADLHEGVVLALVPGL